ncbi:MAG TPA: hypothetical protein VJU59_44360 [Paraburkholderia sp.]|uniref:hypothetical protein n=1 Tax=Paraburkholderia sp. TaxID=1926495 RepID=UPI002B49CD59|nr:hypothetical protein [Paraburkholderia sp.]HKR46624.1 hypothetical protein [Paraburkholderia sp.]
MNDRTRAEESNRCTLAASDAAGAQEAAAYLVTGLNETNEEWTSAWVKRANADEAAARLYRADVTPLYAAPVVPAERQAGDELRAPVASPHSPEWEAKELAMLLRGMIVGGYDADPAKEVDPSKIYEDDYIAADDGVYLRRAAVLLDSFSCGATPTSTVAPAAVAPLELTPQQVNAIAGDHAHYVTPESWSFKKTEIGALAKAFRAAAPTPNVVADAVASQDSAEFVNLRAFLTQHHADTRPTDPSGLAAWALAALANARQAAFNEAASVDAMTIAVLTATGKVSRKDVDTALEQVARAVKMSVPTRHRIDNAVHESTAQADANEPPLEADALFSSAPKPSRQRAARLRATIAAARLDLLKMPPSNEQTGVSIALDDAEVLARDVIDNPVPDSVRAVLERMCTPLDKTWLSGATAEADARCMKVIRDHVLGSEAFGG